MRWEQLIVPDLPSAMHLFASPSLEATSLAEIRWSRYGSPSLHDLVLIFDSVITQSRPCPNDVPPRSTETPSLFTTEYQYKPPRFVASYWYFCRSSEFWPDTNRLWSSSWHFLLEIPEFEDAAIKSNQSSRIQFRQHSRLTPTESLDDKSVIICRPIRQLYGLYRGEKYRIIAEANHWSVSVRPLSLTANIVLLLVRYKSQGACNIFPGTCLPYHLYHMFLVKTLVRR